MCAFYEYMAFGSSSYADDDRDRDTAGYRQWDRTHGNRKCSPHRWYRLEKRLGEGLQLNVWEPGFGGRDRLMPVVRLRSSARSVEISIYRGG
eukprot:COSAG02_NODE_46605_length_347_cov_1.044355_1_plen_91_part_10